MRIVLLSILTMALSLSLIAVFLDQIEDLLKKLADKIHFGPNWKRIDKR